MKQIRLTRMSVVLIVISAILLAYIGIARPLARYWEDLDRRKEVGQLQYVRDTEAVNSAQSFTDVYKEYEAVTKQTRTNEEESALFLREIEQFSTNLSIKMNDIKPMPYEEENRTMRFLLEVEMETTIYDLMEFMYNIATSRSMIRIEKMHISGKQFQTNALSVRLVFSKTFLT